MSSTIDASTGKPPGNLTAGTETAARSDSRSTSPFGWVALVGILLLAFGLRTAELAAVPAGFAHDEGIMGVMGREVAAGQSWRIFFPAYTGQEPLFIYVVAALFKVAGSSLFTLRLVSAGFGVVTVAIAYALGRSLFGSTVGLWTAALTATTFWHVLASRSSYRSIAQPLFEALAIYLLWRGWQRRSTPLLLLSGVALGLTLYTYTASRTFPVALAVCALVLLWRTTSDRGWVLSRFALLGATALVTFAPLGIYFLRHPDQFIARAAQVSVASSYASEGPLRALIQSGLDSLGMFWLRGDPTYRFNLENRPVFDALIGAAFTIGVVLCLRRWRRPEYLLPLIVTGVMMLPSALSAEDTPHFLRSNGVMPFIFAIAGLGIVEAWRWGASRRLAAWPQPRRGLAGASLAVLLVAAEAAATAATYFGPWAHARGTYLQLDTELVEAGSYLQQQGGSAPVYISAIFPRYPSVAFLAPEQFERMRWFDGRECVVLDPDPEARYVFPASLGTPPAPGSTALEPIETIQSTFGWPAFTVYRATRWLDPTARTDATIDGRIALLGIDLARQAAPGASIRATSYWQVLGPVEEEVRLFAHLVGEGGQGVGGHDFTCYYWTEWQGGELLIAGHEISVPAEAGGLFQLELGVYRAASGERLEVTDAAGQPAGESIRAGRLLVRAATATTPEPARRLDATFDDGIRLAGVSVKSDPVDGEPSLTVDLLWEASGEPAGDYTVFVQLLGPDGKVVAQSDAPPQGGAAPTQVWQAGDRWLDSHRLRLAGVAAGQYRLIAGLYQPATGGARLAVRGADARGDYVELSMITVP